MTDSNFSRREMMGYATAFGSAFLAAQGMLPAAEAAPSPQPRQRPSKKYHMKKSINLWALPYPKQMSLKECFELCADAGFDGVEVNYALEGDLSPGASDDDVKAIGKLARDGVVERKHKSLLIRDHARLQRLANQ